MKVIRFLKSVPPYNSGETAAFTDIQAAHYLSLHGIAEDPHIKYKGPQRSPELDPVAPPKPAKDGKVT
jgi:hypothetical protein